MTANTYNDCLKNNKHLCRRCYPRKDTSIHHGIHSGRFVLCDCLITELMRYPGSAGIKGLNSEYLVMNCHYRELVDLPCGYDFYGKRLEEMPTCVSDDVAMGYSIQDKLVMEERQAMVFADCDYFFGNRGKLHTIETQKYPLTDLNGNLIGTAFLINDFFRVDDSRHIKIPDLSDLANPLSLTEARLVFCKRMGLSDKESAEKLGVTESTVRSMKARIRDKTGYSVAELRTLLSNTLSPFLLAKADSFRIL
ncbi:PAS domain-containing protein [Vibrio cholerae]|uniref:PAS domain-containing protein n=1 Tax=Vibrio cholerae TaxID=666 RepID=UPI002DBA1B18|nr:PAS domain-containing protein [Vibrio cholerae]MEB5557043.1 PAS domain-containing protein [Vibrio cholerae]